MTDPDIPDEVLAALARGRDAYRRDDFEAAEFEDAAALALAEYLGSAAGMARARRYLGVCAYQRGECVRSAALLESAREEARALGWVSEELLVCNHLGATYRKLGRLEEADATFRDALGRADPKLYLHARARLTGNYGAFLDDLGDSGAAAEYYARYEELLGLVDDPGRQANAHGLVSRAARLRGDLVVAEAKARQERRLGALSGEQIREGRGWMHLGQALAAAGREMEADAAFEMADPLLTNTGKVRAPVEIANARARFFLDTGRIHEAFEQVARARHGLAALSEDEHHHRARVSMLAAEVAAAAALHGEALWHLGVALEIHLARFAPISDPSLNRLTAGRRRELTETAERMLHEAGEVDREPEERARVEELCRRLGHDVTPRPPEVVDDWRARVRTGAEARWGRLLPGIFASLSPGSRTALVLGDVVSQGPVGDLPRSLFLLFGTIERELWERVLNPLRNGLPAAPSKRGSRLSALLASKKPAGLGTIIPALLEPLVDLPSQDPRVQLERRLTEPARLQALARLQQPAPCIDGTQRPSPLDRRNEIAHGMPWDGRRIDADAVRRVLTLGAGSTLGEVLKLQLRA